MNVFQELASAIVIPDRYMVFLKNKKRKVFGYALLIMFVYFLLTIVIPYVRFQINTGGFKQIIREEVPDFKLSRGKLSVEKSFNFDYNDVYFGVDTKEGTYTYDYVKKLYKSHSTVWVMDQENLYLKSGSDIQHINLSDLSEVTLSKEDVIKKIPLLEAIIIGSMVLIYIWEVLWFFFGVLVISLIGLIVNAACKSKLTFGQVFLLSVYARTTPLLVKGLLKLIGISIPFFVVLNFGATIVYLILVCQRMKGQNIQIHQPE